MKMVFPDYKKSVVNISGSIIAALGGRSMYPPLKELGFLRGQKKIVLLVIDGLGYEFLKKKGKKSFLWKNCTGYVTSVFPSTTATAETSLATGTAPQQHGITGWTMLLKELGMVSKVFPFEARAGGTLEATGIDRRDIFKEKFISDKIAGPSIKVLPDFVAVQYFNSHAVAPFKDLTGMVSGIKEALADGNRFIYAYWADFDKISHKLGSLNRETVNHFHEIDRAVETLSAEIKRQGACLIVTADHGFADVQKKNRVMLQDYPQIYACLAVPLCGEARAPFCYVRPDREALFRKLVKKQLGFCCVLRKGPDLIRKGFFGKGLPNPRLYERVGDYVMLLKDGYTVRDLIFGESEPKINGYHGGLSKEEMYVPLIVFR